MLASIVEFIEQGDRPHTIFASNPEKNFSVLKDDALYEVFKNADLLLPDGIGVVYAARLLHGIRLKRVTGVQVMEEICRLAGKRKYRIFMYGAKEEVNTASVDILTEQFPGIKNLIREGKSETCIHLVGNVMIDNLFYQARKIGLRNGSDFSTFELKQRMNDYVFLTLHRPSNVDSEPTFQGIASALNEIAGEKPILFPAHPRTRKMIEQFDIKLSEDIHVLPPLGFMDALFLWKDASLVMTDSGGLQEETTAMGAPCLTLRDNTERPITIDNRY